MDMHRPKRKEIRLKEYDYSADGAYFVTVSTNDNRHLLSAIRVGDGLPDVPLRFAMSGIADGDCVQMAAVMEGGQAKMGLPDVPYAELTAYGQIVKQQFETMNGLYENIKVNHYVIMPNHIHFIIEIKNGRSGTPAPTRANAIIPKYVSTFKRFTNKNSGIELWQRSYYDHIIRNEADYIEKLNYILTNPAKWADDGYCIQ